VAKAALAAHFNREIAKWGEVMRAARIERQLPAKEEPR
jgi:hypothetical protein